MARGMGVLRPSAALTQNCRSATRLGHAIPARTCEPNARSRRVRVGREGAHRPRRKRVPNVAPSRSIAERSWRATSIYGVGLALNRLGRQSRRSRSPVAMCVVDVRVRRRGRSDFVGVVVAFAAPQSLVIWTGPDLRQRGHAPIRGCWVATSRSAIPSARLRSRLGSRRPPRPRP